MFYAHFVLSKKGPLARIWLAAHWDKKLTKAHVFETNISSSVEAILEPKVKMALRTSGHLLLGVVRIYSRKAKYLLADCNEAFVKIKMAFRPGVVDLPEDMNREAAIAAITLPENFHDFEATMSDLAELDKNAINVNQSRPEDITMREDFGEINLGRPDDDFGDSAFDDTQTLSREQLREAGESRVGAEPLAADVTSILDGTDKTVNSSKRSGVADGASGVDDLLDDHVDSPSGAKRRRTEREHPGGSGAGSPHEAVVDGGRQDARATVDDDDDFGDEMAGGFLDAGDDDDDAVGDGFGGEMDHDLFGAGIFDDPSAQKQLEHITSEFESHLDPHGFNLDVAGGATPARTPATPRPGVHDGAGAPGELGQAVGGQPGEAGHPVASSAGELMPPPVVAGQASALMSNDGEAFTLPPVDASSLSVSAAVSTTGPGVGAGLGHVAPQQQAQQQPQQQTQQQQQQPVTAPTPTRTRHTAKRKRKLIIDEQKSIPSEVMKLQMSDTSDIISSLDLAPPTKKLMFWKETGSVEKLFAMPGRAIVSRSLLRLFTRNLLTTPLADLEEEMAAGGGGGSTPAAHRVPVSTAGGVGDEEATAAMLLGEWEQPLRHQEADEPVDRSLSSLPGNESRLGRMSEAPEAIDGLRAELPAPAGAPVAVTSAHPVPEMTTILEESVLQSGGAAGMVEALEQEAAAAAAAAAAATDHQQLQQQEQHQEQNQVHAGLVEEAVAGRSPTMAANHIAQEGVSSGPTEAQEAAREDPMMPVVTRPQDTPHPTDYFAPETPAPYLNPPSILSMGPPSVLPAEAGEEEGLLGTGAVARQLEREYDEAEEEMQGMLEKEMDENANQEMFEERRLERRSKVMMKMLRAALDNPETETSFDNMVMRNNRKQVASKFYTLLVLRKQKAVELSQSAPYGDITIRQGGAYQQLLATAF